MKVLLGLLLCAVASQAFLFKKIKTVSELDVNKYSGRWYEMYNSLIQRQTFEKNSYCTTATYRLAADGKTILVHNSGRISAPKGRLNAINGTAYQTDAANFPGELIVSFPGTPQSKKANYLVVKLGPEVNGEYAYTIITSNYKAFTWILARDVKSFRANYEQEALEYLKNNGYNWFWNRPRKVFQGEECIYPPM
ncbi:outer membrane lipoprotein Blc-like [Clytia hemisphaerica]|uniref:Lipocalin/cytosolic fatty-acid binding domain-containing protein n=1 Tax=Clytia hemisphaerica TaxID=252671 RepID=A0A7M5XMA0_9CNID|eukprot:TCONS_00069646-protein